MMMYAVIDKISRESVSFVFSVEGYDATVYDFEPLPDDNAEHWRWDGTQFITRPTTMVESVDTAIAGTQWGMLKDATPAQVDAWIDANVTSLASAREVLKLLVLAVKRLANDPRSGI